MYVTGEMNSTVLIAVDEEDLPDSVKVGMNGIIIIGQTSAEVVDMYNAYLKGQKDINEQRGKW